MDKKVIISSKNVEMIYSNRICCFDDEQINFKYKLTDKKEDELKIRFIFNYLSNPQQNIKIDTNQNDEITIKLTNFGSPLGTGLKKPLRIAELNDRSIFIVFNIYKNDESNPILDLSLYMESHDAK